MACDVSSSRRASEYQFRLVLDLDDYSSWISPDLVHHNGGSEGWSSFNSVTWRGP
jgi:hypothetical protein